MDELANGWRSPHRGGTIEDERREVGLRIGSRSARWKGNRGNVRTGSGLEFFDGGIDQTKQTIVRKIVGIVKVLIGTGGFALLTVVMLVIEEQVDRLARAKK